MGWWLRKSAVFYLPQGWFGPLTWWLALPFAPAGSVSCGVWQMACRRVIKLGERVVKDLMATGASILPLANPHADRARCVCRIRGACVFCVLNAREREANSQGEDFMRFAMACICSHAALYI